jgi:hypothetical protein
MENSKDHGIIRDARGEDQPKDKERAQQSSKTPGAGPHAKPELTDDSQDARRGDTSRTRGKRGQHKRIVAAEPASTQRAKLQDSGLPPARRACEARYSFTWAREVPETAATCRRESLSLLGEPCDWLRRVACQVEEVRLPRAGTSPLERDVLRESVFV